MQGLEKDSISFEVICAYRHIFNKSTFFMSKGKFRCKTKFNPNKWEILLMSGKNRYLELVYQTVNSSFLYLYLTQIQHAYKKSPYFLRQGRL